MGSRSRRMPAAESREWHQKAEQQLLALNYYCMYPTYPTSNVSNAQLCLLQIPTFCFQSVSVQQQESVSSLEHTALSSQCPTLQHSSTALLPRCASCACLAVSSAITLPCTSLVARCSPHGRTMYFTQNTPHFAMETPYPPKEIPTHAHSKTGPMNPESCTNSARMPRAASPRLSLYPVCLMPADKKRVCDEARWLQAGPKLAQQSDLCRGQGFGFVCSSSQ